MKKVHKFLKSFLESNKTVIKIRQKYFYDKNDTLTFEPRPVSKKISRDLELLITLSMQGNLFHCQLKMQHNSVQPWCLTLPDIKNYPIDLVTSY